MNGIRTLIKGNSDDRSSESLNEILASEIYRLQGYDNYTAYHLIRIKGKEFVSAYDLISSEPKTNSFASREVTLLSYVRDLQVLDISRLPSLEWVRSLYEKDPLQSEQRILSVMFAYEQKIGILSQLQHGHDPFRMSFGA